MDHFQLAQINIAQAKEPMDSATMKGFVDRLDEVNRLADQSPGFVWRLQTEEGDATTIQAFENPRLIVNMSIWKNIASLRNFVYKSMHIELIRDRDAWFNKLLEMHQALWWIPAQHTPSVEEGKEKLNHLQKHGISKTAFTFAKSFKCDE